MAPIPIMGRQKNRKRNTKTDLMKKILIYLIAVLTPALVLAQNTDYPIQVVPFTRVKLTDSFWLPRIKINHTVTIPASFERCEATGRVKNFDMAASKSGAFCT